MRRLFVFFAIFAASFAPAEAKSVNPKRLQEVTPAVEYVLESDIVIEGYNITYTIRAGSCLLKYRDRRGQYLLGEGECMHLDIHSPKVQSSNDWPDKAVSMELRDKPSLRP